MYRSASGMAMPVFFCASINRTHHGYRALHAVRAPARQGRLCPGPIFGVYLQCDTSSSRKAVSRGTLSHTASEPPPTPRDPLSPSLRSEGIVRTSLHHWVERGKGDGDRLAPPHKLRYEPMHVTIGAREAARMRSSVHPTPKKEGFEKTMRLTPCRMCEGLYSKNIGKKQTILGSLSVSKPPQVRKFVQKLLRLLS